MLGGAGRCSQARELWLVKSDGFWWWQGRAIVGLDGSLTALGGRGSELKRIPVDDEGSAASVGVRGDFTASHCGMLELVDGEASGGCGAGIFDLEGWCRCLWWWAKSSDLVY